MTRVALKTQSRKMAACGAWHRLRWPARGEHPPTRPPTGQTIGMKHLTAHGSFQSASTPNRPGAGAGAAGFIGHCVYSCFKAGPLALWHNYVAETPTASLG